MSTIITSVDRHSPAERAGITPGEQLLTINGHEIVDVLDYRFYGYDAKCRLELLEPNGSVRNVQIKKEEGLDLGLNFDTYLMDEMRCCANHCVFCFVDQMPPGMRQTLYFKDDDARLSFLMGNYITLTNLSQRELQRVIDLRISPLNISVHATNPELRAKMLGHRNGGAAMEQMGRFAQAGITMNCQIVSCPGINDGPELLRSMEDLSALHPGVNSVSVVPVGLTKYRQGLADLRPYGREEAAAVIDMVEAYGRGCRERLGTTIFWCSDEFYLRAERPLPEDEYYEDYTQLENGVGMLRLLMTEFRSALSMTDEVESVTSFSAATGVAAGPFIQQLVDMAGAQCHTMVGQVFPLVNHFFGETIDVAGLITGKDLITQLRGKELGEKLLIPVNMLRHGEDVFLDDITIADVERELKVRVRPVKQDGFDLCDAIFEP